MQCNSIIIKILIFINIYKIFSVFILILVNILVILLCIIIIIMSIQFYFFNTSSYQLN